MSFILNLDDIWKEISNREAQKKQIDVGKRISTRLLQDEENNIQCLNPFIVTSPDLETLKKTLKMNLMTLSLLFILVPKQLIIILIHLLPECNDHIEHGNCEVLMKFFNYSLSFALLAGLIHPIVVFYLLSRKWCLF